MYIYIYINNIYGYVVHSMYVYMYRCTCVMRYLLHDQCRLVRSQDHQWVAWLQANLVTRAPSGWNGCQVRWWQWKTKSEGRFFFESQSKLPPSVSWIYSLIFSTLPEFNLGSHAAPSCMRWQPVPGLEEPCPNWEAAIPISSERMQGQPWRWTC